MNARDTIVNSLSALALIAIIIGCAGSQSLSKMGPQRSYQLAMEKYDKKKYLRAIELFQVVIYNHPGESLVDSAQYFLGMSYFSNKDYELAAVEFRRLTINYPYSEFFEDAVFMRAASFYRSTSRHYGLDQTDLEKAIKQLEDFMIDFPESKRFDDAREIHAEAVSRMAQKFYENGIVYFRIRTYKAAQVYFQKVIDNYTESEFAALATYMLAEADLKRNRFDEARKGFENFITVFPEHENSSAAVEKIIVTAFKAAEKAYRNGNYQLARQKFQQFMEEFPQDGKVSKADSYLNKIEEQPGVQSQVSDAEHR